MERFRLLYLIGELGLGGSERQLVTLLKHLDRETFDPQVLVFNQSRYGTLHHELWQAGIPVIDIPPQITNLWKRVPFIYRKFRQIKPHIVHSWTVHDNPYAGIVGRLAGIPVRLGSLRGSTGLDGFQRLPGIYRWLSLHSTSALVVNSLALVAELQAQSIPNQKIYYQPNGIEITPAGAAQPDLVRLGIPVDRRIIVTVGNLRQVKNQMMFIEALSCLMDEFPDTHGVVIGQPLPPEPELPAKLSARIEALGRQGRIQLAGFHADVPAILPQCAIFCLPSDSEGMPNALMEAMAAGLPVIASRVGGIPELVQDGVQGFLIEPGDCQGLAQALRQLLLDPDLAQKMGRAAQGRITQEFNIEKGCQKLQMFYSSCLQKHTVEGQNIIGSQHV